MKPETCSDAGVQWFDPCRWGEDDHYAHYRSSPPPGHPSWGYAEDPDMWDWSGPACACEKDRNE